MNNIEINLNKNGLTKAIGVLFLMVFILFLTASTILFFGAMFYVIAWMIGFIKSWPWPQW